MICFVILSLVLSVLCFLYLWQREMPVRIKFKLMSDDVLMPKKGNARAAGIDFYAAEDVLIEPGKYKSVPLGVAWEPSRNDVFLLLKGRSGLSFAGIEASNAGVVDPDYRGEIRGLFKNRTGNSIVIKKNERCCQGIVLPLPRVSIFRSSDLSETERGNKGFGSTGVE
jgi:dUTP pyrophosphatase